MKKKRIALTIIVAVALAAGGYFGLMQFRDTTPVLAESFGILQPIVPIPDVKPGYDYLVPLTILCGKDRDRVFTITLEEPNPNKIPEGYVALPEECYSWIHIDSDSYQGGTWKWDRINFSGDLEFGDPIIIEAGHYRQLTLILTMPDWVGYYSKQAEVRVRVTELSAEGFTQIAIESKWYIITASLEDMQSES